MFANTNHFQHIFNNIALWESEQPISGKPFIL